MEQTTISSTFKTDILQGLLAEQKHISSKYFYDDNGSRIFQKIMNMPEYYLTNSEFEIFEQRGKDILKNLSHWQSSFDLVELGAGDGIKTAVLLEHLLKSGAEFKYVPVDISEEAIQQLVNKISHEFPKLLFSEVIGDYFEVLHDLNYCDKCPKLALFLGSNIGNYSEKETIEFFLKMSDVLKKGDMILTGFDLVKDPEIIIKAYNDPHGFTSEFNLNLLHRMNRELEANFNVSDFKHKMVYDEIKSEARSYIVSTCSQKVHLAELNLDVSFDEGEAIHTEMSRKFSLDNLGELAEKTGFSIIENYLDEKGYFTDSLWIKN